MLKREIGTRLLHTLVLEETKDNHKERHSAENEERSLLSKTRATKLRPGWS